MSPRRSAALPAVPAPHASPGDNKHQGSEPHLDLAQRPRCIHERWREPLIEMAFWLSKLGQVIAVVVTNRTGLIILNKVRYMTVRAMRCTFRPYA